MGKIHLVTYVLPCDTEGLAEEECSFLAAFPADTSIEDVVQKTVESFPIDNLTFRRDTSCLTLFVADGRRDDLLRRLGFEQMWQKSDERYQERFRVGNAR